MNELIENLAYEAFAIVFVVACVVIIYAAIRLKLKRNEENEEH